jgi:hypothetical protein
MFLYVILISQTWLDLPAEQRLADRDLRMADGWLRLAGYAVAAVAALPHCRVDALHCGALQ